MIVFVAMSPKAFRKAAFVLLFFLLISHWILLSHIGKTDLDFKSSSFPFQTIFKFLLCAVFHFNCRCWNNRVPADQCTDLKCWIHIVGSQVSCLFTGSDLCLDLICSCGVIFILVSSWLISGNEKEKFFFVCAVLDGKSLG